MYEGCLDTVKKSTTDNLMGVHFLHAAREAPGIAFFLHTAGQRKVAFTQVDHAEDAAQANRVGTCQCKSASNP